MKIIITDGFAVNPGDLSWDSIAALGDLEIYERMPQEDIIERCKSAEIILSNKVPLDRSTLGSLPFLKLICVLATGYNVIDAEAAAERNIRVCNVPAYSTSSVAQHTLALILELTNHVGLHSASVAAGEWVTADDWCYTKAPVKELAGKTLGIIGFGNTGKLVSRIALAFGMKIICNTPHPGPDGEVTFTDIRTVFRQSDVVSVHCPLKNDNYQFINRKLLELMKPAALVINTARGQLIHEQDLADALNSGLIAGAALDVLSAEPPQKENPLLNARHCIITPHNAWMSREARQRIINITAGNINGFLQRKPVNVVN